jgi:hypothetical protein
VAGCNSIANVPGEVQCAFDALQADNLDAYFVATESFIEFSGGHWKKHTVMLGFVCLQNACNGKQLGKVVFQIVARLDFTNKVSSR